MDPITETIVWGVVWFFGGSVVTVLIYFLVFGLGCLLAAVSDKEWIAPASVIPAWICGVVWEIFVFIQVIIHIVTLIQLIAAG